MTSEALMSKNFLTLTKYFNKQPKKRIISSYLSEQFAFLSSKHTTISFLDFYNYISLPYELSFRLFKTLTDTKSQTSPEHLLISYENFITGLSRLYSDCTVEKKIEIAMNFVSQSIYPDKIYKDDIEILFCQFHMIKNKKDSLDLLYKIINDFFQTDVYLTLEQFKQRSFYENSTLLYLGLFYLVYYHPFQYESIDFFERNVYQSKPKEEDKDCDVDVVDFFFVQSFPKGELYEYLYQCFDILQFDLNDDLEELVNFENNITEIKTELECQHFEYHSFARKKHLNSAKIVTPVKKRNSNMLAIRNSLKGKNKLFPLSNPNLQHYLKLTSTDDLNEKNLCFEFYINIKDKTKYILKLSGDDIYIFKIEDSNEDAKFRQIISLKQLYIKEGSKSEDVIDSNGLIYHTVHLISTIKNKVSDSVIYIVSRTSIIKLRMLINSTTKFKSLDSDYNINAIIGKGAFGTVVKAKRKKDNKDVAVKILQKDYNKPNALSLIRNEIDIVKYIKSLELEGVVKTYDIIEQFDIVCLIQEYADGGSLGDYVLHRQNSTTDDIDIIYSIVYQLINTIKNFHKYGIIHRDLKCDNVMLDKAKNVKIIDFGLAGIKTHHDAINDVYGTLPYLSPEIVKGEMYSDKVDVWALGILCYKLLYAKFVFQGDSVDELMAKILYGKIELSREIEVKSKKAKVINEIIMSCLKREAAKRPDIVKLATMIEMG